MKKQNHDDDGDKGNEDGPDPKRIKIHNNKCNTLSYDENNNTSYTDNNIVKKVENVSELSIPVRTSGSLLQYSLNQESV